VPADSPRKSTRGNKKSVGGRTLRPADSWSDKTAPEILNRISTARSLYLQALDECLPLLARADAKRVHGTSVICLFAAGAFPKLAELESVLSDPSCREGWVTPFGVRETTNKHSLAPVKGAKSGLIQITWLPRAAWYPLSVMSGLGCCVVQWSASDDGKDGVMDDVGVGYAIEEARFSVAQWRAFWETDAREQRERPYEWFQSHLQRLQRHVRATHLGEQEETEGTAEDTLSAFAAVRKSARALRDLSSALLNDALEMDLPHESRNLGQLQLAVDAAHKAFPRVLEVDSTLALMRAGWHGLQQDLESVFTFTTSPAHAAHHKKLFPKGSPANANVRDVVLLLADADPSQITERDVIRKFTGETSGEFPKARKLEGIIRRMRGDGRLNLPSLQERTRRTSG
jgi:hypothetical protein